MTYCEENPDQDNGSCCLHDLPKNNPHYPGRICCWCGDLFQPHTDADGHGEYEPGYRTDSSDLKIGDLVLWTPKGGKPRGSLMSDRPYYIFWRIGSPESGYEYSLTDTPFGSLIGVAYANELSLLQSTDKDNK